MMRSPVAADHAGRRARLAAALPLHGVECAVIASLANIRYLAGFTGSHALLAVSGEEPVLLTDPRYEIQARQECDTKVRVVKGSLWKALAAIAGRRRWRRIAVEAAHVSHAAWSSFENELPAPSRLVALGGVVEQLRMVKSPAEQELIRASARLTSAAYAAALALLRPGITEIDFAAEIDHQMRRLGAERPAFETIVAAGARTALPHARPTANAFRAREIVLVDVGAFRAGYASDMTRVAFLGKPKAGLRRLYRSVWEAQQAALAAVRPGIAAGAVDRAARVSLRSQGLDKLFTHSTGHGLGLEIHEAPRLGRNEKTRLEAGMVITIEPGAYREGVGGIRIEDTVLVTGTGAEVFGATSKEMLVI